MLDDGRAALVDAGAARDRARDALRRDPLARPRHVRRRARHAARRSAPGDTAAAWYIAQALIAAEAVGAVDVALETSVAYAKERHTFGRAIGSYQAVKHELVEILRGLDNARSLMYYAGWAAQDKPDEFPLAASAFRLAAGKAFDHAARAQISVHGGIGATWEHDAPLYFRRAQLSRRLLGGTAGAADRVAGELHHGSARGGRLASAGHLPHEREQQRARATTRPPSIDARFFEPRDRAAATGDHRVDAAARDLGRLHPQERRAASPPRRPAPAFAPNSVWVKPGHRHVTLTPVPPSSACTASENDCTNALLAA